MHNTRHSKGDLGEASQRFKHIMGLRKSTEISQGSEAGDLLLFLLSCATLGFSVTLSDCFQTIK